MTRATRVRLASTVMLLACLVSPAAAQTRGALAELSLEELANVEVTSISRRPESVADAPAAIYVITADDIRRSGAQTLPETLRLAPNLLVARLDAGQYAITARGFNGLAANKLLVLVDGRTIYTPLFSGVFWHQQDVLLEDVERTEVISGPGATMRGSNAVNGVISVITRAAGDTQGTLASVGAGNRRQSAAVRYGGVLGDRSHFRLYGKATNLERNQRPDGVSDGRHWLQAGFRADWGAVRSGFTLQGDLYRVRSEDRRNRSGAEIGRAELSGLNLLALWAHQFGANSELRIQTYVDHAQRRERVLFQPEANLFDVEMQHSVSASVHRVVWGAGYRHGRDDVEDGLLVGFRPTSRAL